MAKTAKLATFARDKDRGCHGGVAALAPGDMEYRGRDDRPYPGVMFASLMTQSGVVFLPLSLSPRTSSPGLHTDALDFQFFFRVGRFFNGLCLLRDLQPYPW